MQYLADTEMGINHVRMLYGERCAGKTEQELMQWLERLNHEKTKVLQWAKMELEKQIVGEAVKLKLRLPNGVFVESFAELQLLWSMAGDYDEEYFKEVLSGIYKCTMEWKERYHNWNDILEEMYMRHRGIVYDPHSKYISQDIKGKDEQSRGCIARLFTCALKSLMRRLNYKGKKRHGVLISAQRSHDQIQEDDDSAGKRTKRKRGWQFIRYDFKNVKQTVDKYYAMEKKKKKFNGIPSGPMEMLEDVRASNQGAEERGLDSDKTTVFVSPTIQEVEKGGLQAQNDREIFPKEIGGRKCTGEKRRDDRGRDPATSDKKSKANMSGNKRAALEDNGE